MRNKKTIIFSLAVGLLIVLALFVFPALTKNVEAETPPESGIHGFAWSSNIGWISFNHTDIPGSTSNYAVTLQPNSTTPTDKDLSGFAWSPNIGWVRFDPTLVGPLGATNPYGAKISGSTLTGWARACSVFANSNCSGALKSDDQLGGWDGWIKMSNVNYDPSGGHLSGYAWGSLNVGWVFFGAYNSVCSLPLIDTDCNAATPPACDPCIGPCVVDCGGGFSVRCTATPTSPSINALVTWQVSAVTGGPIVGIQWADAGGSTSDPLENVNPTSLDDANPITTRYFNPGTYKLKVTATDGSGHTDENVCNSGAGVTVTDCGLAGFPPAGTPPTCCNGNPPCSKSGDPNDGNCGPCEDEADECTLNFIGRNNYISYTEDDVMSVRQANISIDNCNTSDLSLTQDSLPFGLSLVCNNQEFEDGNHSYSEANCDDSSGLINGNSSVWVGVKYLSRPTGYSFGSNPNSRDIQLKVSARDAESVPLTVIVNYRIPVVGP